MKSISKWLFTFAVSAFAVLLAAGATVVSAQEPETVPAPEQETLQEPVVRWRFGFGGWHGGFGVRSELLAEALGITVEELEEAQQQAYLAALEEAVEEGEITEEQADLLAARQALQRYVDREQLLAAALGVTAEELEEALDAGQSLSDIIEAQGLDAATLRDALQAAYEEAVEEAVDDGVITQEQADEILSGETFWGFGRRGFRGLRGLDRLPGLRGLPGDFEDAPALVIPDNGP